MPHRDPTYGPTPRRAPSKPAWRNPEKAKTTRKSNDADREAKRPRTVDGPRPRSGS